MRALPLVLVALVACDSSTTPVDTADTGLDCAPTADPGSVLWEEVLLDSESSLDVMVTNPCDEDITLEMATDGDAAFRVPRATLPLTAGETTPIQVIFQAADLDEHSGELLLSSPGGTTHVPLQGQNSSDWDQDGYLVELAGGDDCDDAQSAVHPGAVEIPCDGVDSDCDGALDVAAVGTREYSSMDAALDAAGNGQSIWVCPGTHPTHARLSAKDLTLLPWDEEADPPVLDGEGTGRILDYDSGLLQITGMVLAHGAADGDGGAIHATNSQLELERVSFHDNTATGDGGAIGGYMGSLPFIATECDFTGNTATGSGGALSLREAGEVVITSTTLDQNTASGGDGGSILVEGSVDKPARVEISDSVLSNSTASGEGGGLSLGQAGSVELTLRELTLASNRAAQGGALAASTDDATSISLETCSFTGNTADEGGAVYYDGASTRGELLLHGGAFSGNSATTTGGCLEVRGSSALSVEMSSNVNFTTCSAPTGGALYLDGSTNWTANLEKVYLKSNEATQGAAMYLGNVSLLLREGQVQSNTATDGGAAFVSTQATLTSRLTNWGSGSTENEEHDVVCEGGSAYDDYAGSANFSCQSGSCH